MGIQPERKGIYYEKPSKAFVRMLALCIVFSLTLCVSTYAATPAMLQFTGTTDAESGAVSLLLLKKGTDPNNATGNDIVYIDQGEINNGQFSLDIPVYFDIDSSVDVYSNMSDWQIEGEKPVLTPIYVSSTGDDANDGTTQQTAKKTIDAAAGAGAGKIILVDNAEITDLSAYKILPPIEGLTNNVQLTLPATTTLYNNLKLDKLVLAGVTDIYANGFALEIGEGVTMAADIAPNVFGGKHKVEFVGDTSVTLLGGTYGNIYGGGRNGTVTGDTYVTIGGKVNAGQSISDSDSNCASTHVYGGGLGAVVSGKTNVTLKGDAIVKYLVGAGAGENEGVAYNTNIFIEGGKAMNVFGGCASYGADLTNCNTNIVMTGGEVESIFGGSEKRAMTGNTTIELKGGTIKRRVYTGCYNDWEWSWKSSHYVTGTTTLLIYPQVNLALNYDDNTGIFAGSRRDSKANSEVNTIIFMDGCYNDKYESVVTEDSSAWLVTFQSYHDYVVDASANGKVNGVNEGGKIFVEPAKDYVAKIGNNIYRKQEVNIAGLTSTLTSPTKVNFEHIIGSASASEIDTGVKVEAANMNASVWKNETIPVRTLVAVYEVIDGDEILVGVNVDNTLEAKSFNIDCTLKANTEYIVYIMMWNKNNTPMIQKCRVSVPR